MQVNPMVAVPEAKTLTLEEWVLNPPERTEWVEANLLKNTRWSRETGKNQDDIFTQGVN